MCFFFSKLPYFLIICLKIDDITLDPDPNWAKILDPNPNSMYLDPQHWAYVMNSRVQIRAGYQRVKISQYIHYDTGTVGPNEPLPLGVYEYYYSQYTSLSNN